MKNIPFYEVRKINDLRDMLHQSVELYGDKTAFMVKEAKDSEYVPITYNQFGRDVDSFGTAMHSLGYAGSRIAILAESRYAWYVSYMATVNGIGTVVPLDKELPRSELASLLNRAHADVLIYSHAKESDVTAIRDQLPEVKCFISMDDNPETKTDLVFEQVMADGRMNLESGNQDFLNTPIDSEAARILLFTSGTTAISKAVMLSHRNICINLQAMCQMINIVPDDIFLSVLPLHHTYECTCGFLCPIYRGATVAVCEGLRYIRKNLQESHATVILVVPLMVEAFQKGIFKAATADPKLARKFNFGLKLSKGLGKVGIDIRRKIFSRVHENFGGQLRLIIAGGAAIDPAILQSMRDLGFATLQGYGLTECAPILALNRDVDYKNESAGLPLPGVEVRIVDKDEDGIGEIIGRGPNVMIGYYEDPEATAEAIDDEGFFHTGDLGYIDEDGFVIITGRKKNVIITKNGKNIFPEEIEYLLNKHDLIQECLVFGGQDDDGEVVVRAEIFPNMEVAKEVYGITDPLSDEMRKAVGEIVKSVNHQLSTYKYVRSFTLRDSEFEKTTSKKIRRKYAK
ncbi:MAG: AMP-dependent synthetase/ligase [Saccharofermentanales bacterium]|jgi:long-chain acyl-CoA synthetase